MEIKTFELSYLHGTKDALKSAFYDADGKLLSEVEGILTKGGSDETVEITVDGTLFGLGIGFMVKNGDKIYFGSEVEGTVSGAEEESALYDKMTINVNENTVTFENTQATNLEAITLSLDSVNIEFVETLVEELEAADSDADVALTPEL